MTTAAVPISEARSLFGSRLLSAEDAARVLSLPVERLVPTAAGHATVPYARATLERARDRGDVLVYRVATDGMEPLTIMRLLARFPEAVQPKLLKGVGYQLKDEWTIGGETFATAATCVPGWRLVHSAPVEATCNLNYEQQDAALARYAETLGLVGRLQRRTAIEIVYDTVMLRRAHGTRLLERAWDWSSTPTQDGGFATAGEFGDEGLSIIGYSRAVRFGTLGVCPQL